MSRYDTILDELIELTQAYATAFRFTLDPVRAHLVTDETTDFLDENIREPLLMHVGHAPILAIHLHPYLQTEVDLGHALKLLAVHDIGELEAGDVLVTEDGPEHEHHERIAAKLRLSEEQFTWFIEFQDLETPESRFAKSVDKICPDIVTFACDRFHEKRRMEFHGKVVQDFYDVKIPCMQWDPFMKAFYEALMQRGRKLFM